MTDGNLARGSKSFDIKPGTVVAMDFESFYDSKQKYSLRNMTPYDYVHDPRFDAYLVALTSEDGQRFVGSPEAFDWLSVTGAHLIAHNMAFDGMVLNRLCETGVVSNLFSAKECLMDCTADMVAFFCIPRSLKDACHHILGRTLSKKVRTEMDGKTLKDLGPAEREDLIAYGGSDADNCLDLWKAKSAEWPEIEREISRANREAGWRGIRIDRANTIKGLDMLRAVKARAEAALPWVNPLDPKKSEKAGSTSALASHAMRCGLPVPHSFNKQDPGMQAWVAKYAKDHPFIQARLDHASVTPHIARLESMVALADAEDVLRFDARYHAAHTGRSSGSGSGDETGGARFNAFNIPKGDPKTGLTFGVDMRGLLIPRPGYKYDIRDYSNVEPRITHWLAGNTEFLARVFKENIYQAAAKTMGWYPQEGTDLKNEDKKTYQLSKACTIGLGYGMGAAKFLLTCEKMGIELPRVPREQWVLDRRVKFILLNHAHLDWRKPEDEEMISKFLGADQIVAKWRQMNPQVQGLWKYFQSQLETAAQNCEPTHTFTLPSGRKKIYYNPHFKMENKIITDPETGAVSTKVEKRLFASTTKGYPATALHGGPITENIVQATARDVMFWGAVDIIKARPSWHYVMNCYDEVVFEVPEAETADAEKLIPECLCRGSASSWTQGLPLEVEGGIRERYEK